MTPVARCDSRRGSYAHRWGALLTVFALSVAAHALKLEQPPGSLVRTGPGPLELHFAAIPDPAPGTQLRLRAIDSSGSVVYTSELPVPSGDAAGLTVTLPLQRLGTYFVEVDVVKTGAADALSTTVVTVAAIPDNRHHAIPTTSPFAMGCYFAMRYSPEELKAAVRLASMAGVAYSREELRWDISEPSRGKFDWERFDRGVATCLENHIGVLGLLDYWGAYHGKSKTMTDEAVRDFSTFVKRNVVRYKPGGELGASLRWPAYLGVTEWEIWNEPATFWSLTAEEFGRLTRAARTSAHEADPRCRVFYANAGDRFDEVALRAIGATMGRIPVEGVCPHFYCPPRSPKDANLQQKLVNQNAFLRNFTDVPLWISEMGWWSDASHGQQNAQADYLVQSYVQALSARYEKVFWYNFVCDTRDKNAREYGLLNREDLSPRISYAAFAGMVRQLEGATGGVITEIGRNVSCYVFHHLVAGDEVAVIWADAGEGHLVPESPVNGFSIIDRFGNLVAGESDPITSVPVTRSPHYVRSRDAARLNDLLKKSHIEGIPQIDVQLTARPSRFARTDTGEKESTPFGFVVENFTREQIQATLTARSNSLAVEPCPPARVEAVSSVTLTARATLRAPNSANLYPLEVSCDVEGKGRIEKRWELGELVAVRGTCKIDGDLAEWKDARRLYLNSAEQAVGINPWMDWNLSATYCFMWDEDNLYFAGRVRDNVHCQPNSGDLIWEGDSWQLGFDATPGAAKGQGEGKYCYGLALTSRGPETAAWEGKKDATKIRLATKRAKIAAEPSPGGPVTEEELVYECAIPRDLLQPAALKPGARIGFSVLLNDNDGGGRAGWMESSPAIGTGFNPERFQLMELVP
jgi:hypothetical protein